MNNINESEEYEVWMNGNEYDNWDTQVTVHEDSNSSYKRYSSKPKITEVMEINEGMEVIEASEVNEANEAVEMIS